MKHIKLFTDVNPKVFEKIDFDDFEWEDENIDYTIKVGETFEYRIDVLPSTGYVWNKKLENDNVSVESKWLISSGRKEKTTYKIFRIKGESEGTCLITFSLKRGWEKKPIKTKIINVKVI